MKKVLIITYYWPPAGGPGVQRVLKFAKYLPELGWQPIILTVKNGEYSAYDQSLEQEIAPNCVVHKTDSLEPNALYKKFVGYKRDDKIPVALLAEKDITFKKKVANWIRLNLFIPDAKIGWKPFAVREGKKIINELKPDVIFSSSPPPTVHLIAKELSKYSGLKWVADFRDPWTDIHYYEGNKRYSWSKKIDQNLENSVLQRADFISCISQLDIEESFSKKVGMEKCFNIPNGYDEQDFIGIEPKENDKTHFLLIHTGAVGKERNPIGLFKAIKRLSDEGKINEQTFSLKFIGNIEDSVLKCIKDFNIMGFIKRIPYIPHKQAIQESMNADMMLLLVTQSNNNRRILPGKTFEYMRMCSRILMLGPEDGETARIIQSSKAGIAIDYNNHEKIYNTLKQAISGKKDTFGQQDHFDKIKKYERKYLTKELVKLFD